MVIMPPQLVAAPPPRGLRYGLFTAGIGPLDLPAPNGLAGGVTYDPQTCGHTHEWPVECPPGDAGEKVFDPGDDWVTALPFVVYATYVCGAASYTAQELEAKVRRRLANGEQTSAERLFSQGLLPLATLQPAPEPDSITSVFGELEQWLYGDMQYGQVGMIHAPARASAYAAERYQLVKDGVLWRTPMGTVVSFGGGYPDGLVFITGQTTVWRAADVHVPSPDQTFDRENNQWNLLAEREYAVGYDCLAAVSPFDTGALS